MAALETCMNRVTTNGDPMKDGLTSEIYVERLENLARANASNAEQTIAHFQNSLKSCAAFRGRGHERGQGTARGGFRGRGTAPSRGRRGNSSNNGSSTAGSRSAGNFNGKCYICGKFGHRKKECHSAPKAGLVRKNNSDQDSNQQNSENQDQSQYNESVETVGLTGINYNSLN